MKSASPTRFLEQDNLHFEFPIHSLRYPNTHWQSFSLIHLIIPLLRIKTQYVGGYILAHNSISHWVKTVDAVSISTHQRNKNRVNLLWSRWEPKDIWLRPWLSWYPILIEWNSDHSWHISVMWSSHRFDPQPIHSLRNYISLRCPDNGTSLSKQWIFEHIPSHWINIDNGWYRWMFPCFSTQPLIWNPFPSIIYR